MAQTTITKAHKIANDLRSDLLKTGAIDEQNNVVKSQMFIDIIEHAESELTKLVPETENEAGVTIDKNAANIVYNYLSIFVEMKETMSVHPEMLRIPEEQYEPETPKKTKTPSSFKFGIKKVFGKIKSNFTKTPDRTESR